LKWIVACLKTLKSLRKISLEFFNFREYYYLGDFKTDEKTKGTEADAPSP